MTMRGRTQHAGNALRLAAGATALALVASGCGSGDTGANAVPDEPVVKATGTPYVIGTVGTYSGSYAASNIGAKEAMEAWVAYTNDHGGINNHPIQLISKDDQLNAASALSQVKELVEQDHVMAIVGVSSNVEDAWMSYVAGGNTPVIGDNLAKDTMAKLKNFFPQGTTRDAGYFRAMPKLAASQGKTKYAAIYCAESTACSQIAENQKQQAPSVGASYVYSASAKATDTDYTAQCLAARESGADAVGLMLSSEVAGRVATACAQQGFRPQWLLAANGFSEQQASTAALDGVMGPVPVFPWFSSEGDAQTKFQNAMKKYKGAEVNDPKSHVYSGAASQAWASAEIFRAAAEKLPEGTGTSQDLLKQLYNLPKDNTFGGLTPPITYGDTGGPQAEVRCFYSIQLKSRKFTTLNDGKTTCL